MYRHQAVCDHSVYTYTVGAAGRGAKSDVDDITDDEDRAQNTKLSFQVSLFLVVSHDR